MSIHLALSIHTLKTHLQTQLVFRLDRFILHFHFLIDFRGDVTMDVAMTTQNHISRKVLGLYNLPAKFQLESSIIVATAS